MENRHTLFQTRHLIRLLPLLLALIAVILISLIGWLVGLLFLLMISIYLIIRLNPEVIFPFSIIMLSIGAQLPAEIGQLVSMTFSFIILIYWGFWRISTGFKLMPLDRTLTTFILFTIIWLIMSSLLSSHFTLGIYVTFRQIIFFLMIYIIYDWLRTKTQIRMMFNSFAIMGVILSMFILFGFAQAGFEVISIDQFIVPIRYTFFNINPNALGTNLLYSVPVVAAMLIYNLVDLKKPILILMFSITLGALFLTFSRASWLGVAVSLILILFTTKYGRWFLGVSFIISFLIGVVSEDLRNLLEILLRFEHGLSHRDILWKAAWEMFSENPVFGTGPWTYRFYMFSLSRVIPGSWSADVILGLKSAHNLYLTKAAEMGIGGIITSLGIYLIFAHRLIATFKTTSDPYFRGILFAFSAILAGSFARSMFEVSGFLFLWTTLIMVTRIGQINKGHNDSFSQVPPLPSLNNRVNS